MQLEEQHFRIPRNQDLHVTTYNLLALLPSLTHSLLSTSHTFLFELQAIPQSQQKHLAPENALKLQQWLDKGIDTTTFSLATTSSDILFNWAATLCRVWPESAIDREVALRLVPIMSTLAVKFLQAVALMGKLRAAGVKLKVKAPNIAEVLELASVLLVELCAWHGDYLWQARQDSWLLFYYLQQNQQPQEEQREVVVQQELAAATRDACRAAAASWVSAASPAPRA